MSKTQKAADVMMVIGITFGVFALIIFGIRLIVPYHPIEGLETPFHVDYDPVEAGTIQRYHTKFTKTTDVPGLSQITLELGERTIFLGESKFAAPAGDYEFDPTVLIPEETPAGIARILITTTYDYGLFKKVTVKASTDRFVVVSPRVNAPLNIPINTSATRTQSALPPSPASQVTINSTSSTTNISNDKRRTTETTVSRPRQEDPEEEPVTKVTVPSTNGLIEGVKDTLGTILGTHLVY